MNIKTIIATLSTAIACVACGSGTNQSIETFKETKEVPMEVVFKKEPKRFKIVFKDESGNEHTYSKKRCAAHTNYVVGQKYMVPVISTYTQDKKLIVLTIADPCDVIFSKIQ